MMQSQRDVKRKYYIASFAICYYTNYFTLHIKIIICEEKIII